PPERATVTSQSCAASCHAVVLAGESSGENIDCWWFGDVMDVSEVGNVRPVVSEDLGCVRVEFGLPGHVHAGTFGGEVEPSDPGEQGTDLHVASPRCSATSRCLCARSAASAWTTRAAANSLASDGVTTMPPELTPLTITDTAPTPCPIW